MRRAPRCCWRREAWAVGGISCPRVWPRGGVLRRRGRGIRALALLRSILRGSRFGGSSGLVRIVGRKGGGGGEGQVRCRHRSRCRRRFFCRLAF